MNVTDGGNTTFCNDTDKETVVNVVSGQYPIAKAFESGAPLQLR